MESGQVDDVIDVEKFDKGSEIEWNESEFFRSHGLLEWTTLILSCNETNNKFFLVLSHIVTLMCIC